MSKVIAGIALLAVSFGITVGHLILGWGLRPQSWAWIVVFWVLSVVIVIIGQQIQKET